ncbi:outer membrane porin, OprD family [Geopseudomonas sagittaria]|uniref:Outer membrane porin, OprD family n=1 Tax=Geopseudomonas sagittaria TaxID=1135990 RepID=A0A1I5SMK5_9GAMM|nr:OprD family porin [Pseudomonas sagittaria]SFP71938.1 outer membrane porin, OprD family [Pseudomonas sagittaria]
MIKTSQRSKLALGILAAAMAIPAVSQAALVEDSKASLELRNMYLNRDFRDGAASPSYGETWAQGFIAKFESGYTEGTVGVGVDALGLLGVKLDSSRDRTAGNMLPLETNGDPVDEYSQLGLTAKARISKSTLHMGTLLPVLPVVQYNNTRLLPSSFTGGLLTSQEITGLTLHASRLEDVSLRDSSDRQSVGFGAAESAHFDVLGGSYAFNPQLTASYYYGELQDIYKQHFGGLVHSAPLGEGLSLRTDLRYFNTKDDGDQKAGEFDSDFFNGMVTLGVGGHKFGVGYQNMSGDGVFPFMNGADPYSVNLSTFWTFARQEEDAYQVRYDYDFASIGIPGLAFMTRYVSGYNIEAANGSYDDGKEWERDTDIVYTLQDGSLKGLRFHVRNVTYRAESRVGRDVDENRLIVSYTLPLL